MLQMRLSVIAQAAPLKCLKYQNQQQQQQQQHSDDEL